MGRKRDRESILIDAHCSTVRGSHLDRWDRSLSAWFGQDQVVDLGIPHDPALVLGTIRSNWTLFKNIRMSHCIAGCLEQDRS